MNTFRVAAGILATIPFASVAYITLFLPPSASLNSIAELIYMVFGIPILIVNLWAWMYPEIIEVYFFGKDLPS